jgi:hypothetical protein
MWTWPGERCANSSVNSFMKEVFLFFDSMIDLHTVQAYRETHYCVFDSAPFVLQVDVPSDALVQAYKLSRSDCCTFVTACNPLGVDAGDVTNAALHSALRDTLNNRSLKCIDGAGRHPSGSWPEEPSYLVLGLSLEAAKTLGKQLAQNAIIWAGHDRVPKLVLLR